MHHASQSFTGLKKKSDQTKGLNFSVPCIKMQYKLQKDYFLNTTVY